MTTPSTITWMPWDVTQETLSSVSFSVRDKVRTVCSPGTTSAPLPVTILKSIPSGAFQGAARQPGNNQGLVRLGHLPHQFDGQPNNQNAQEDRDDNDNQWQDGGQVLHGGFLSVQVEGPMRSRAYPVGKSCPIRRGNCRTGKPGKRGMTSPNRQSGGAPEHSPAIPAALGGRVLRPIRAGHSSGRSLAPAVVSAVMADAGPRGRSAARQILTRQTRTHQIRTRGAHSWH